MRLLAAVALGFLTAVSSASDASAEPIGPPDPFVAQVVARAREEVTRQVDYDSTYVSLAYPGGDVDPSHGVCTDVVIRALRAGGIDLQPLVHDDEIAHPAAYGLGRTSDGKTRFADRNIDHRRVRPLLTFFRRHLEAASTEVTPARWSEFHPGDIVVFTFTPCPACRTSGAAASHIGIVSDRTTSDGRPLVLHNVGPHPTEDDALTFWPLLGHFHLSANLATSS